MANASRFYETGALRPLRMKRSRSVRPGQARYSCAMPRSAWNYAGHLFSQRHPT